MTSVPLNRIVAFVGPFIAVIAGALADWLLARVHVLGTFRDKQALTSDVSQMLIFIVTTGVVWLGQQKWLQGWIAFEASEAPGGPDDQGLYGVSDGYYETDQDYEGDYHEGDEMVYDQDVDQPTEPQPQPQPPPTPQPPPEPPPAPPAP